ncbi:MAG: acetolactate synthase small subunit [Coriobacteriales bacterium]|jgi:acetolactate synthase-1/3 small subunit|nr:acetolactate synthase small subunit [Coriobacteriales bacterium]
MAEYTLSILVDNKPGVLTRVTGLIARRGYNIESLAVDKTEDPRLSRVTLVTTAEEVPLEQIKKQLHKLINVHKITELTPEDSVDRELALFKIKVSVDQRPELIKLAEMFKAQVIDVATDTLTLEATGDQPAIARLEELLRAYGIVEMARSGKLALPRGKHS